MKYILLVMLFLGVLTTSLAKDGFPDEPMYEELEDVNDAKLMEYHKIIDHKIREHEAEIKQLKALKGSKRVNEDKIRELLAYHAPSYKLQAPHRTEGERIRFIKNSIFKDLKKVGSTSTPEEIDELLINWPD